MIKAMIDERVIIFMSLIDYLNYHQNIKYSKQNMKKSKSTNLDKWGKDEKHNILYIMGISGSGKSTLALSLKKKKIEVIHLDSYFCLVDILPSTQIKNQNKNFNDFLKKNAFNNLTLNDKILFDKDIKKYFKNVDKFTKLTEKFGLYCYHQKTKLIIEGVELMDDTMYPNKSYFNDKPCIILKTDEKLSRKRASKRDKIRNT